ncbi:MAG: glycoside hydrolase family 2 TIM barrel-domain containing protein [Clostridia bacterium]|nr:glycoside hydrolase family 2 TIM barrel-domain containing protein [Clostridia bacterium]
MKTFEMTRICNPSLPCENTLSARVSSIPALHEGVYFKNKEDSELITILNGDFKFRWSEKDIINDFYISDFNDSDWDTLTVPSMWQYNGYSLPVYPNVEYSIPFDPPYVGNYNPVGYYRRKFQAKKTGKNILYFGGVDSAYFVYLNGEYIGFAKGSREQHEFDVSSFLKDGENTLAVKVFTYSDGTYLENQDMLLASGIFRDIYLLNLADISVFDYTVRTSENKVFVDVILTGDCENVAISVTVDGFKQSTDAKNNNSFIFEIDNPKLWNAETPNTYNLLIELKRNGKILEMHSKKFGFAKYEVVGNKLLLNGQPITLKGINRHEHTPKNGRAIPVSLIEKELNLIKEHNFNAIRCAHYPNNPAFYEIATELGLYIMNEADIESHGSHPSGDMGYLAKLDEWYPSYIDRVERMYAVDKNDPCISIHTIGNENGEGKNIDKCIKYLRNCDVKVPIMHTGEDYINPQLGDFRSEGYFTMEALTSHPEDGKPVMMLEYGHAMGNSPGLMEDTWDYVYKNRHIVGGYVWEFKCHGFYNEDENGTPFYQYGGDFGDINHWSNFSMDGYLLSDGTPKPSLRDCKNVLAPTYIESDGESIYLTNTNDFLPLDYVTLNWEILEDYTAIKGGSFTLPPIMPYERERLDIDTKIENPVPGVPHTL